MSSNPESDADTIRNKRLARLQAFQRPSPSVSERFSEDNSSPQQIPGERSQESKLGLPTAATLTRATPSASSSQSDTRVESPVHESRPTSSTNRSAASPAITISSRSGEAHHASGLTHHEVWEDRTLSQIFKVAVSSGPRTATGEYRLLKSLRAELESSQRDNDTKGVPRLSVDLLDQVILSTCTDPKTVPMNYLVQCWMRVANIQRSTPSGRLDSEKLEVLKEVRRLCVQYALNCIAEPEVFEDNYQEVKLDERLLADADDEFGLPQELLVELVRGCDEEPRLLEHFAQAMIRLSCSLSDMNMTDNYKPHIYALGRMASVKALAELFTSLDAFLPSGCSSKPTAERIEKETLLGPFLRISPLQKQSAQAYFSGAKTKAQNMMDSASRALRLSNQTHQDQLHQIIMSLVRASEKARGRVLDFFAETLNMNKKRGAMQVDAKTVASDGFMYNITGVLSRMCEPFMDTSFTKLDRIDVDYFRRTPRLDITDETKINADERSASEYYASQAERKSSFITEVFFLNVAAHHYGLSSMETQYESLARDIQEMERHLERLEQERAKFVNNATNLAIFDRNVTKMRDRLDEGIAYKHAMEVVLFDTTSQARSMLFMRYLITWLLRVVDPSHQYPQKAIVLPLPATPPHQFNHFPEYFVEDIGLCIGFVSHYVPECIVTTQLDELLVFCITFLRMSDYVQKPNLKSKLVEIMFYGIQPYRGRPAGYLGDLIHGTPFVVKNLMHALMSIYIDIEKQYYEKFTVRYHIAHIIKAIWTNQAYRDKLEQESNHNVEFFIRFVALLLNDVTHVLNTALPALADIRKLQDELTDQASSLSVDDRAEKEKALSKKEKEATSYMQLGNETVAMLRVFTSALVDAFVQPEIVSRLAAMLDYNLEAITGPKCSSLKVRNPEKYRFVPKQLLSDITDVYLNLASRTPFVDAIARDGRSYKPELFERALSALRKAHLKTNDELSALETLADRVKIAKTLEDEGDMELGEIPEEFQDPLLYTLMTDPVILPSSHVRIDRQTIKSHLLSDPTDPFNRAPLKIEDVNPDVELKRQIDAWVAEQRALAASKAKAGSDAMDIDW